MIGPGRYFTQCQMVMITGIMVMPVCMITTIIGCKYEGINNTLRVLASLQAKINLYLQVKRCGQNSLGFVSALDLSLPIFSLPLPSFNFISCVVAIPPLSFLLCS